MGKKNAVKEMEFPKEYDRDFEYFNNKHDELLKAQQRVCCRKEPASLQQQGPLKSVGNFE